MTRTNAEKVQYLDVALLRMEGARKMLDEADPDGSDTLISDAYDRLSTAYNETMRAADYYENATTTEETTT